MISGIYTHRIDWSGITIEVSYEPNWLNISDIYGESVAHLQVRSLAPKGAPLPFTETGYRSAFPRVAAVLEHGGPAGFVRHWLDDAASSSEWVDRQEAARQLALF